MKLALHRSITFWSGILVMASLCWVWRDSLHYYSSAWKRPLCCINAWGGIVIKYQSKLYSPFGVLHQPIDPDELSLERFPGFMFIRHRDVSSKEDQNVLGQLVSENPPRFTLRQLLELGSSLEPRDSWTLFIPQWLILLAVALPWSALLLWRARRRKRALEKSPKLAAP